MKSGELSKRRTQKANARAELKKAEEEGDTEAIARLVKRTVTVTKRHNDECKQLLELMGMPVVQAPCEAEATCAALAKAGLVYATGTEDMDALTLGTPILLRRLTFAENRKMPIMEINLQRALTELNLTMDQVCCGRCAGGAVCFSRSPHQHIHHRVHSHKQSTECNPTCASTHVPIAPPTFMHQRTHVYFHALTLTLFS
jgi:XPG I-region